MRGDLTADNVTPPMPEPIYLDNNATTRPLPEVVEVVAGHFRSSFANPGSRHGLGRKARQAYEDARETVARVLGAKPQEVVFTSGGTESTNLAVLGFTQDVKPGRIALTAGEHPATMEACRWLEEQRGFQRLILKVNPDGRLLTNQFENLSWDAVRLATVILAHNETGVIQDIAPLAERCRRHGVPLHVDAVQAVGKIPVDFGQLDCTSLSLGAHKFHGPRGVGALLLREGAPIAPVLHGGHQEGGRRPGTEPVALAVGMAKALELWDANWLDRARRMREQRDRLEGALRATCAPVVINGSAEHRLPNTLNIAFPGCDGDALLVNLDLEGVCCSIGSACASGSTEPAPALVAMGVPPEVYSASIRFSLSFETTAEEVDEAARRTAAVVARLRQTASAG